MLYKIRCESRVSGATHKDYKIRREIPQRGTTPPLGLRWGFKTTSREIDVFLEYGDNSKMSILPEVQI